MDGKTQFPSRSRGERERDAIVGVVLFVDKMPSLYSNKNGSELIEPLFFNCHFCPPYVRMHTPRSVLNYAQNGRRIARALYARAGALPQSSGAALHFRYLEGREFEMAAYHRDCYTSMQVIILEVGKWAIGIIG